jgi:hypothetical protein
MRCDSRASFLARNLTSLCLGREPKVRVATLILGLNVMRATRNIHNQCVCSCENICISELSSMSSELSCVAQLTTYNTMTSLWSLILCSKDENDEFHVKECIMKNCHRCDILLLKIYPEELHINRKTQW